MINTLPLKLRRGLAVAILAVVILGTYSFAIGPAVDGYTADRETIDQLSTVRGRYERAAREVPELSNRLEALRQRGTAKAGYLEGEDETVAAAVLQERLKSLLQQHGGVLKSTQVLNGKDEGPSRRISIRGNMTATLAALQRVIYDLEAGSPLLFVDNLDVRAGARVRGGADADQEPQLDVNFDVSGYLRRGA